jgi:hypothetical protein
MAKQIEVFNSEKDRERTGLLLFQKIKKIFFSFHFQTNRKSHKFTEREESFFFEFCHDGRNFFLSLPPHSLTLLRVQFLPELLT